MFIVVGFPCVLVCPLLLIPYTLFQLIPFYIRFFGGSLLGSFVRSLLLQLVFYSPHDGLFLFA